ncbi:MAG: CxxxxCH/CxxCH domain-containing protein [Bacteroidota bacterium]
MKKQRIILILMLLIISALLISCSDLKNSLPTAISAEVQIHGQGWIDTGSVNFHGKYIQNINYNLTICKQCHGSNYEGGTSNSSCRPCHSGPGGPENCATCHGIPPAPDRYGNTSFTAPGVGAHNIHYTGTGTISALAMHCDDCHHLPNGVSDTTHITATGIAQVQISNLGALQTNGAVPSTSFSQLTLKCTNTFCHGNWTLPKSGLASDSVFSGTVMTGVLANAPVWNGGSSQAVCGSCHGLPPAGHYSYSQSCTACHEDVTTASGKLKHMNGKIDLAGGVVRNFR